MTDLSLRELQQWMKSRIRADGTRRFPPGSLLNPQRGVAGEERIAVYAEGYLARVQEALAEVYEAVRHVVGDHAFAQLSRAYVQRYPSHDYNLSLVGRHLPVFLAAVPLTQQLPFLPDLAALEWLIAQAFHAFEQTPLDSQEVAARPLDGWNEAYLRFQPSVSVLASAWPVLEIWEARIRPLGEIHIDVVNRPQRILVSRQGLRVRCQLLQEPAYELLRDLLAGQTLGEACRVLARRGDGNALPVATWFSQWVHDGLVVQCEIPAASGTTLAAGT